MDTTTADSPILRRTLELCEAIVEQPDFKALKGRIDAFMSDDLAKFQYQQVNDLGQMLQMKQENGMELQPEEIGRFEAVRKEFLSNPVATDFLDAQREMQELHQTVARALDKTFELGRRPSQDDLQDGSCGSGCGCH